MEALDLRASAMPRAFKCGGTVRLPVVRIRESSEPADLGSAAHEALRPLAEGGSILWQDLAAIAGRWGSDVDELRMLCSMAAKLWPKIADSFTGALSEAAFSVEVAHGIDLTGHVDLVTTSGTVARIADWKTGRLDSDYSHQMKAYGALVLLDDPHLTEVSVTVIWVRDQEIENYTMTRADAEAWVGELVEKVIRWDGAFTPGSHCGFCPRSHECPASTALVRRDVAAMLGSDEDVAALVAMTDAQIIDLYRKATTVVRYAERARAAIKAHVEQRGDIVADGVRLTLVTEERRSLDTAAAWPVLEAAAFDHNDLAAVVDVKISKVEKRVAEKAGRGKGAGAVRAMAAALDAAGAVKIQQVQKLTEKRS